MLDNHRKITIEIFETSGERETDPNHKYFNVRVVKVEDQSDRQRCKFYSLPGQIGSMTNTTIDTVLEAIKFYIGDLKDLRTTTKGEFRGCIRLDCSGCKNQFVHFNWIPKECRAYNDPTGILVEGRVLLLKDTAEKLIEQQKRQEKEDKLDG